MSTTLEIPTGVISPQRRARRFALPPAAAFVGTAIAYAGLYLAAGAPSPLFVQYQQQWGFPAGLLTIAFAAYALGLVAAILVAGSLSDFIGRRPVLVVDEVQLAVALGRQAQRRHDHVGPVCTAHPARAYDRRTGPTLPLPCQLGSAVDRHRTGVVPFAVGAIRGAVEDVVGRHVDHVGPHQSRGLGHVTGADGVHGKGQVGLGLAAIDRGERAAVEDELGPEGGERGQDGVPVVVAGNLELDDGRAVNVAAPATTGATAGEGDK